MALPPSAGSVRFDGCPRPDPQRTETVRHRRRPLQQDWRKADSGTCIPADPRILGEVGGLVIAEDGPRVLVVDREMAHFAIVAFVTGVVAMVFGGFGTLTLFTAAAGHGAGLPLGLCIAMLAIGAVAAVAVVAMVRRV